MSTIPPSSHLQSTGIGQSIKHHHKEIAYGIAAVSFIAFGILLAVKPSLLQLSGNTSIAGSVTSLLFGTGFTAAAIYNLVKNTKQRIQEQYEENKKRVLESTTALEVIIAGKALKEKYPDKVKKEKTIKIECSNETVELPFYVIKALERDSDIFKENRKDNLSLPNTNSNSLKRILNFLYEPHFTMNPTSYVKNILIDVNILKIVDVETKILEPFLKHYNEEKSDDVKEIIELYEEGIKSGIGNLLKSSFGNFISYALENAKEPKTITQVL